MYNTGFRLVMRRGPQPNQIFELNKDIISIGRDVTNEITINDPEVSRHHCRLTRGPSGYTIEDLGSTNGTFVNGQRLTGARPLSPNDLVGLGETVTIAYDVGSGAGVGAAPSAPAYGGVPPDTGPTGPAGAMPPAPSYAPPQPSPQPQPIPGYYEQPPQPAPPYMGGYQQQGPPSPAYTYSEPPMPRSRGCGLWIGCGVIIVLALIFVIVGIIVVDSPLDDMPFISDAADAISLPGTSVDNTEKFFEAVNSCDLQEAEQYVCTDQQDAIGSLFESCQNNQYEDISCEKDGNDVTCTLTFNNTELEQTMNIQNGKVCGTVNKFEASSDGTGQEFDTPSDSEGDG
jgi:hypothetical protein